MHFSITPHSPARHVLNHTEQSVQNKDGVPIYVDASPKNECVVDQTLKSEMFELDSLMANGLPLGDRIDSFVQPSSESADMQVSQVANFLKSIPNEEREHTQVD